MSDRLIDLAAHNTFRVSARCSALLRITDPNQLPSIDYQPDRDILLGDGSNVLLANDVPGRALLVRLTGREIVEESAHTTRVWVGAGEDWHDIVRWTLGQGLSGLENLSLIPGRAGAAPIQNIGAYGVELAERLESLAAWDWQKGERRTIDAEDCAFSYRDSRFKSGEPGRFLILGLTLNLPRHFEPRLDYQGIDEELVAAGVDTPTPTDVSDAVVRLRRRKLPDPAHIGNAGSFFKNPLVTTARARTLSEQWPDMPLFSAAGDRRKVSAAWMIERCGWKGYREGDAGVSDRHALVLVNHGEASGAEIKALANRIQDDVNATFDIDLEPEPRIVEF